MGWAHRFYAFLPAPLQHCAVTAYGYMWRRQRLGPGYREEVAAYEAREAMPREARQAWEEARRKAILSAAADHVPHYRARWSSAEKEAARAGDLSALPLTTKDALRQAPEAFCREDMPVAKPIRLLTSGSTGTPLEILWTLAERRRAIALREARSTRWAGVSFDDPRATFSGRIVVPAGRTRGPFHRYNAAERQVYFSAFHLSAEHAPAYVEALHKHGTTWLTGYAVSLYLLATHMLEQGLRPPPLRAIITTSEKVTAPMRAVMERAYGCRVYEEYGTVENASFASACEHGSLHVSTDAGVLEILRPDGTAADPGEEGSVVVTGLMRSFQPLVRFSLSDTARWSEHACACGRSFPVLEEVSGRIEDVVVAPDGRAMVRFHGLFLELPHIVQAQVVQTALDALTVRIVTDAHFGPADEESIRARVRERLGTDVHCTLEVVDAIAPDPSGKYKAVISELPADQRPAL